MIDSNENFVKNNVTVESDEVIEFMNPFKNHQQHQIEDFSLFLSVSTKCRCCFSKFINESDQHTVESCHRKAFFALTEVEMMTPDSENFLCLKCVEILKIYTELGQTAANLQRKYNILTQDLASDIKTERDETNEISSRLQDYNLHSDIVKSDYEIISYDNEQSKQTNIIQNEIIYDGDISLEESFEMEENSTKINKCTIRLTRIDPETIEKFEYYSIVGSTEEKMVDQISSTSAKLAIISHKDETNANLRINIAKCHICGKTYKNTDGLKRHIRYNHNGTRLTCDLCGKSLCRKENILQHMQSYHLKVKLKFSCHLCSAEFESIAKLRGHKKIIHSRNFKCVECDAAFGKTCLLSDHVKAVHKRKQWYCHYQDCSASFYVRIYANQHFRQSHSLKDTETIRKYLKKYLKRERNDQSKTKCQFCGMIAKDRVALFFHIKKTHSVRFFCDLCGETFSHKQKMDLIDHMHKHHMNVKFSCNLCHAEFLSHSKYVYHENYAHKKKFKCENCDASFLELGRLRKHVEVKHEGKLYNCQVPGCSKSFSWIETARRHLKSAHLMKGEEYRKYSLKLNPKVELRIVKKEPDLMCQICGKICKNVRAVSMHVRVVHNKNKSCDLCGKTFSLKRILTEHMHTHHMNLRFSCNICSLELRSEKKLVNHKRYVHDKKIKCKECDAIFGKLSHLAEHVKVKHERKRYHCSYPDCSISFAAKLSAIQHLIYAHSLVGEKFNKFKEKLTVQSLGPKL